MKKLLLAVALVLVFALTACGKKSTPTPTPAPTTEPTVTATPTEEPTPTPADINAKGEGVMTYAEYIAAADDAEVVIECYVQDHQSWWDNKISVYAADGDGAYFLYNLTCSEEDSKKLVPGTKIKVTGYRATWSGEIEVAEGATFEFEEGSYIAPVKDVTDLLGTSALINYQNLPVAFKNVIVSGAATYKWDGSGTKGDDLYFQISKDGKPYTFTVESYLRGADTDVYKAVEALKVGDIVDLEGFLYWYNGANPHITKAVVTGNVADKAAGVMTYAQYAAAADDDEVTIECYVQDHQSWWDNKITVYAADADGAYFIYNMVCSEEDAKQLTPGTKIRVKGFKTTWSGEVEVAEGATFEFVSSANYIAPAVDVTTLLADEAALVKNINRYVSFKGMKVESAATYKFDGSGKQGDDLYFKVSEDGKPYTFTVESYLRGADTEVYKAVEALKAGDVIDLEGFLYWYNGPNPHITVVAAAQ